jgi:HEPN domain-containing protein
MATIAASVPLRKTRRNFQRLAELRAREAKTLAKAGNQHGAYYLGGFAIECALKACIARQTRRHDFPADAGYARSVYTHDLGELLKLSRLNTQFDNDIKTRPQLAANWGVVKGWNVDSRYETSGLKGKDMVAAVNSSDGVLEWIKLYW